MNMISRRSFIKKVGFSASAAGIFSVVTPDVLGQGKSTPPSERVGVGLIGCGLMGRGHLHRIAGDTAFQLIAVCDPDKSRRDTARDTVNGIYTQKTGKTWKDCLSFNDYREVLERKDIDAVVIVTPDHWHALMSVHAAKAGKDIYCEKPVSVTIQEGRFLADTVKTYARVFQTGTQYRSAPVIRQVCEFVRGGGLGKVMKVFTILNPLMGFINSERFAPYFKYIEPQKNGHFYYPVDFPLPAEDVPEGLDWEMWVGPAPWKPYNKLYHINPSPGVVPWSFCDAFGAASNTWHLSHSADVIQYAIGMETSGPVEIIHPADGIYPTMTFKYANGVLLHFVDGWNMVHTHYKALPANAKLSGLFGGVFIGEKGWITSMSAGGPIEGAPEDIFDKIGLKTREVNIGANNHHANWLECIKSRRQPSSHEEIGHRSASMGHLAMISFKLGRSLKWDPEKEVFINDAEANRLLSRPLREPWRF